MSTKTKSTAAKDIKRVWYHMDAKGQVLGRLASRVAQELMGKRKVYFVKNLDCGDYVVITNSKHIHVTGKKEEEKTYTRYSGFPGGLRTETLGQLRNRKPNEIIRKAVYGMLPKNKLRDRMIRRLHIFPDETHPYTNKLQESTAENNAH